MYAKHCLAQIAPAMKLDAAIFERGVLFAVLSIRQTIRNVPAQLEDVTEGRDYDWLFGHKMSAYQYLSVHRDKLHRDVIAAKTNGERIDILTRIPGLGIVKAAFILQLMGYDVACLDSRNIKREGRNPRAFRADGEARKTGKAWARKIARYVAETEGRAQEYWDHWCADVAQAYDMTPTEVSELHLCIIPDDYVPF
jgi:hypothetical protein